MKNWSMDLEHGSYENDIELVIKDAIQAVVETKQEYINQCGCGGYALRVSKL